VARDVARGYYTREQARERLLVAIDDDGAVVEHATNALRDASPPSGGAKAAHHDGADT
jgi:hypothetical protein